MQSLYGAIANTNKKEIMAVSIDRVYQKVLALANKEQRGYITPQEFNLFADHAQMEIFEQYFYDSNQFQRRPGNDSEYHDIVNLIDEKLAIFRKNTAVSEGYSIHGFYKLGNVYLLQSGFSPSNSAPFNRSTVVEEIKQEDLIKTQNSPLTRATDERPVYYLQDGKMYFYPPTAPYTGGINFGYRAYYIRNLIKPNWTYVIDPTAKSALYNPDGANHQDFELHKSEEPKLVIKILQLAGVNMKDFNLAQLAGQKEASVNQQEKQ
jgi:hypothetical protein